MPFSRPKNILGPNGIWWWEGQITNKQGFWFESIHLLTPSKLRKVQQVTPLVVAFHLDLPHLSGVLRECQCLMNVSQRLKGAIPGPLLIVYWCPPNLRSFLVRAALRKLSEIYRGNSRCRQPRCKRVRTLKLASHFAAPLPTQSFM